MCSSDLYRAPVSHAGRAAVTAGVSSALILPLPHRWSLIESDQLSKPLLSGGTIMRVFLILGLLAVATLTVSACNTVQGFGQDLESAGKTIKDI